MTTAEMDADGDEDDNDTDENENRNSDPVEEAASDEDVDASSEEDLSESDDGNENDDGHNSRNSVPTAQGVTRGRIADPSIRMNKESGRSDSGADAVAAFQRYSLQSETSEICMIESSDVRIPTEHSGRLSDPFDSDSRVRACFRGVFDEINDEAINSGRHGDHAQLAAQQISGILQREIARSVPGRQNSSRDLHAPTVPDLQYALAKALLVCDRVGDAIAYLQKGLTSAKGRKDLRMLQACQRLLVHAWRKRGEPGEAIFLLDDMIRQQRVQLGEGHASVLSLEHALAAACEKNRDPLRAVSLLKQVIHAQNKLREQHHGSQSVTLHLLLRSQTSAGQKVDANTTISRIVELNKRSNVPLSPLQVIPQSAHPTLTSSQQRLNPDPRPPTRNSGYATSNTANLQRPVNRMISGQPRGATVPPEPQNRVTTSIKRNEVPTKTQPATTFTGPSAPRHAEGQSPPQHIAPQIVQNFSPTTVIDASRTLVQVLAPSSDRQGNSPDMTKRLTAVENELARTHANLAQREKQLTEESERLKHRVGDLQKQIDDRDKQREAEHRSVLQRTSQAANLDLQQKERISRLEQQLQQRSKQTANLDSQQKDRISRLEEQLQTQHKQTAILQSQNMVEIRRLEEQLRQSKQSEEVQSRQAARIGSLEQELRACRTELGKAEEDRRRNIALRRVDEPVASDLPRACLSCAETHSAIRALRQELGGQGLGGGMMQFLARLDPARSVAELVASLCEGFKDFLRLHEKRSRDIEAKLRGADTSIADYKNRLAGSSRKVNALKSELDKARLELKEALAKATGHVSPQAQQESVLQATPWVEIRWPMNRETQTRENAFNCSI